MVQVESVVGVVVVQGVTPDPVIGRQDAQVETGGNDGAALMVMMIVVGTVPFATSTPGALPALIRRGRRRRGGGGGRRRRIRRWRTTVLGRGHDGAVVIFFLWVFRFSFFF